MSFFLHALQIEKHLNCEREKVDLARFISYLTSPAKHEFKHCSEFKANYLKVRQTFLVGQ